MNRMIVAPATHSLLKRDIDYHLIRASMVIIIGTCMLALVPVAVQAQHQTLVRPPQEAVQPTPAATSGAPTLPEVRLAGTHNSGSGGRRFAAEFLTPAQRAEIWHSLSDQANRTSVPMGLNLGETIPKTIRLLSFADDLRKRVPPIWPYSYALLHGQVLIVDPRSKAIIAIVAE